MDSAALTPIAPPLVSASSRLDQVWAALDQVMDPELDEPITDMGFVETVALGAEGDVQIAFRLPTYWCSPNFAFLMAQDIKREVEALGWTRTAHVTLLDHMAAEEMNAVVNAGGTFSDVFTELTKGEDLAALREKFDVKAFQRRQEVVIKALLALGMSIEALVSLPLATLQSLDLCEAEPQKARYLRLAYTKGIAMQPHDLALPSYQRTALTPEGFPEYMNLLRSVRINMEFSGTLCRGLKTSRYKEVDSSGAVPSLVDFLPKPAHLHDANNSPTQAKHCG